MDRTEINQAKQKPGRAGRFAIIHPSGFFRSRANEVRLWLSVIAYNLGSLRRRLVLPLDRNHLFADEPAGFILLSLRTLKRKL